MRTLLTGLRACVAVIGLAGVAFGQGGTTSTLSGTATDSGGGVVPGASVVVTHDATGVTATGVTNAEGVFSFPALKVGSYTVTVSLEGFKTVVVKNVVLTSASPANVRVVLEVGGLAEQVTVSSSSEIVQTQSPTVSSTITTNQITKLPLTSRSAMDFVNYLPGVTTANGNRQAVINGLPRGTINITLDGVNVQDNTLRTTDGFFAIVSPRIDAIEEVTVSTAAQGAGDAGQGAVQIKFVTRSGTNNFTGSGYYYVGRDRFNANTWFNNRNNVAKAKLKQDQGGLRAGGPIVIPGLMDGHNKAFFFVNYEEQHQPSDVTRNNRTVLNPSAQAGNYCYSGGCVNVLDVAARNGQTSKVDPVVGNVLSSIRSAVSGGSLSDIDPNLQRYAFNVPVESVRRYPTFRLDYNVNASNRASFAYNYQKFTDFPDTLNNREASFPGFPTAAGQSSKRLGWSSSVRSTLSRSMVNEARLGYSGAPVSFFSEMNTGMFKDQGGFRLLFPSVGSALTNPSLGSTMQQRNANSLLVEDTLNWLKGSHSISVGGSFTQYDIWRKDTTLLPTISFGVLANDPAASLFNGDNFPDASTDQLSAARNLYALLTGRVSSIGADARLDEATGKYAYTGLSMQRGRQRESGLFVQDAWRLRQDMTLSLGLRYDIQQPFQPLNSLYSQANINQTCGLSGAKDDASCNLFQPGKMPGQPASYSQYTKGSRAHKTDLNNVAPSLGFAWTPSGRAGLLGPLMGREGDFVIRAGYNRAYSRPGLNDYSGRLSSNPGITIDATRSGQIGNLGSAPLFFSNTAALGPPAFAETPIYPLKPSITDSINTFAPNLQVPSTDSWSAGFQRTLTTNIALEVRYVGTRSRDNWQTLNYNEFNIVENGFLTEFQQAQGNLQANLAAGKGATFAYTGAPGTAPLPVFLAFFNGVGAANANSAAAYTGTNWTNSTFVGYLAARNPQPFGFASTDSGANSGRPGLLGSATFRANAARAGLMPNYFVVNPETLGGANVVTNLTRTRYNAMQIELRRRYAQGLQFNLTYAYGREYDSTFYGFRFGQLDVRPSGNTGDIPHAFKSNVVYDLPFGRGRHWGSGANGVLERLIGGWQLGVASRWQSGTPVDLGNVRLVGMSKADVQKMFKLRFDDTGKQVYMLPDEVIQNTLLAFNVSATSATGYAGAAPTGRYFAPANGPDCVELTPTFNFNNPSTSALGYGSCGIRSLTINGPTFQNHDIRISKRTAIVGRTNVEFAAQLLNAFNHANFLPVAGTQTTNPGQLSNWQLTTLQGQDRARAVQLEMRFNW